MGNELRKLYTTLGASNHVKEDREINDYYATDPKAMELLLKEENFSKNIWECACGGGHISEVLKNNGYNVINTDIVDCGYSNTKIVDFLESPSIKFDGDIITNPPYSKALDFCKKALETVDEGHKVAMFLKLLFLEGKARKEFFTIFPPRTVYVSSSRIKCAKNGKFDCVGSSAIAYAWFVWEKGYKGDTVIKWIN